MRGVILCTCCTHVDSGEGTGMAGELSVYPPIYRLGSPGRWIRDKLMTGILSGTPVLLRIQSLRTAPLNASMGVVSFLGEEEFYTLLVVLILWVCDARLGRLLSLLMAISFYVTGFCKNLLCLPRPPAPPIVPLHRCSDWSLPSHHAVLSVNVPWYIWAYVSIHYASSLSPSLSTLLFISIALWSFLVMFSRMYLGVHSPADILTGGIIGCIILVLWLQNYILLETYLSSSREALPIALVVVLCLLSVHPDPPPTTIIFAETVCMVGVAVGALLGWIYAPVSSSAVLERVAFYSSYTSLAACCLLRFVMGLPCVMLAKVATGVLTRHILSWLCALLGIPCVCVKRVSHVTSSTVHHSSGFHVLSEPPSRSKKPHRYSKDHPLNLDIPVKFVSYIAMGTVAVAGAPTLFYALGI